MPTISSPLPITQNFALRQIMAEPSVFLVIKQQIPLVIQKKAESAFKNVTIIKMKFLSYLKSRTILTILFLFFLGGFQAISGFLPENVYALVNGFLLMLAVYFRIDVKAKFQYDRKNNEYNRGNNLAYCGGICAFIYYEQAITVENWGLDTYMVSCDIIHI